MVDGEPIVAKAAADSHVPSAFSLAIKTSLLPAEVSVVLPKLALPLKLPVISEEPSARAVIPLPLS